MGICLVTMLTVSLAVQRFGILEPLDFSLIAVGEIEDC